ncbi:Uu.00g106790.m01.CDS01 [Anthostomella pinea]|uniref:Uu.00g106790.m01.CDS01 n=1 Tax=Anthostomella pinea TaxID=933095 RepID=A0AAI8YG23_9PEZI|nr:Uu.00g106790.m01.CDS01 [Anthostomella pinea]
MSSGKSSSKSPKRKEDVEKPVLSLTLQQIQPRNPPQRCWLNWKQDDVPRQGMRRAPFAQPEPPKFINPEVDTDLMEAFKAYHDDRWSIPALTYKKRSGTTVIIKKAQAFERRYALDGREISRLGIRMQLYYTPDPSRPGPAFNPYGKLPGPLDPRVVGPFVEKPEAKQPSGRQTPSAAESSGHRTPPTAKSSCRRTPPAAKSSGHRTRRIPVHVSKSRAREFRKKAAKVKVTTSHGWRDERPSQITLRRMAAAQTQEEALQSAGDSDWEATSDSKSEKTAGDDSKSGGLAGDERKRDQERALLRLFCGM